MFALDQFTIVEERVEHLIEDAKLIVLAADDRAQSGSKSRTILDAGGLNRTQGILRLADPDAESAFAEIAAERCDASA